MATTCEGPFPGSTHWNNVHDALLAAVFVDECCKSLLSRLSCITTKDKAARSVKDWQAEWQSLRTSSARVYKTITHPRNIPLYCLSVAAVSAVFCCFLPLLRLQTAVHLITT